MTFRLTTSATSSAFIPDTGKRLTSRSARTLTRFFPRAPRSTSASRATRLYGPGISDNGAGSPPCSPSRALLRSVRRAAPARPLLFIGNVGEEGEGDLRGMRHIFATPRWKDAIAYSLMLDGAGSDTIVAEALGSRRFEITVRGPGGHSWSDFGAPNPIVILARAIERFCQTPVSAAPKTTFNIGVIRGGTSVNSIPESASMRVDLRSTSGDRTGTAGSVRCAARGPVVEAEQHGRCARRLPSAKPCCHLQA